MTTTTQQHTQVSWQAPWQVLWGVGDIVNPCKVYDSKGEYVATCATPSITAVCAAAPDLLAALERSTQRIAELCAVINAHAVGVVADATAECAEYRALVARVRG